jgi:hypothetical protein
VVTRSYIGVALDGTTDAGNGLSGIRVAAANCVIGNANVGNVISGNGERGILAADRGERNGHSSQPHRHQRRRHRCGAQRRQRHLRHRRHGVIVGGAVSGQGNLISGNGGLGIDLDNTSASWTIQGNWIGVDATGTAALGNGGAASACRPTRT